MPAATGKLSIWPAKTNAETRPGQRDLALVEDLAGPLQADGDAAGGDDAGASGGPGVDEAVGDVHGRGPYCERIRRCGVVATISPRVCEDRPVADPVDAILEALRADGGRVTTGRRAIVTALVDGAGPPRHRRRRRRRGAGRPPRRAPVDGVPDPRRPRAARHRRSGEPRPGRRRVPPHPPRPPPPRVRGVRRGHRGARRRLRRRCRRTSPSRYGFTPLGAAPLAVGPLRFVRGDG